MLVLVIFPKMNGNYEKLGSNSGGREHGMECIDGGACWRRCTWTILNLEDDHIDGEAYYKRDRWPVNSERNNSNF